MLETLAVTGYEHWQGILPAAAMATGGFVVMIVNLWMKRSEDADLALFYCGLGGALLALITSVQQLAQPAPVLAFADSLRIDGFAAFLGIIISSGTLLTIMMSYSYHRRLSADLGDYLTLVLFSASGMMLLACANELITIFVGVELMSIPIYILVGQQRGNERATEASVKYLVLGAFASAFLLMGLGLLYGLFGTVRSAHGLPATTVLTDLTALTLPSHDGSLAMAVLALGLLIVGFGFKVGAVPFHQWVPDVYDGAPTAITGFMAVAVKAATFGIFLRIVLVCFPAAPPSDDPLRGLKVAADGTVTAVKPESAAVRAQLQEGDVIKIVGDTAVSAENSVGTLMGKLTDGAPTASVSITYNRGDEQHSTTLAPARSLGAFFGTIMWIICGFSIVFGNLVALAQTSIKRMLAYSSIAHSGYILLGVIACTGSTTPGDGWDVLFYLLVYTFMSLAAFAVVILAGRDDHDYDQIDQLQGLAHRRPFAGLAMLIAMLSLAGIPLTGGFVGKLGIFYSAIMNGYVGLALIAIIGSLIGIYYYLRVAWVVYMKPPVSADEFEDHPERFGLRFTVTVCTLATIVLGVFPWAVIDAARHAINTLRGITP
ncbi:MAG: proton-conducting transporter membrane subunit [Planctomycetota bacterium]